MRRALVTMLMAVLCHGCGVDRNVGQRFEAERDLWRADWQARTLSVSPRPEDAGRWSELASEYEAVGDRYLGQTAVADTSMTNVEIQHVAARALFRAAQIQSQLRDSLRAEQIYQRMQDSFDHLPMVAAEVALTRGVIAERRGAFLEAAGYYQTVVDRVQPRLDQEGPASRVLELPLRIARMHAQGTPEGDPRPALPYQLAVDYYRKQMAEHSGEPLQMEAQALLANCAADRGEWSEASLLLEETETQLGAIESPHRDPAELRLLRAEVLNQSGASPEETRVILQSLLDDYPDSELRAQALLALANNATRREQTDEAVELLDRLRAEHADDEQRSSEALLGRARLLARAGRWSQALESYRLISVEHPISEAALTAPIEIAQFHASKGDEEATQAALERAEREYREFIDRYPPGPSTLLARQRLAETLALKKDPSSAVTEMERLGELAVGTPRGYASLTSAAGLAISDLADTSRAVGILDRIVELYPAADWAKVEADRLRGAQP